MRRIWFERRPIGASHLVFVEPIVFRLPLGAPKVAVTHGGGSFLLFLRPRLRRQFHENANRHALLDVKNILVRFTAAGDSFFLL